MPTPPIPVPTLPDPPTRLDPTNFRARADARLAAEPAHTNAMNALGTNVYNNALEADASAKAAAQHASSSASSATLSQAQVALAGAQATAAAASAASALAAPSTSATSVTSMVPGTGVRAFVTQAGKAFVVGQPLNIVSAADPSQWMVGVVASYAGTALSVNVTTFGQAEGAAASADWVIAFSGALPPAAKPGQVLRLRGATPEWSDEGGAPIVISSALNRHPNSADVTGGAGEETIDTASAIGPRGTRTASVLSAGAGAAWGSILLAGYTVGQTVTYERSVRAVSGSTLVRLSVYFGGDMTDSGVIVDLANGAIQSVYCNNPRRVMPEASVRAQGNGWYRIALCFTVHTAGSVRFFIAADVPNSVYHVADASVTDGRYPKLYVDVASGTPVAGAGARRRNLVPQSREVDTALGGWLLNGQNISRLGRVLSPVGDVTATAYAITGFASVYSMPVFAADTQYTFSVWLRVLTGNPAGLRACQVTYDATGDGVSSEVVHAPASGEVAGPWRRYSVSLTNIGAAPSSATVQVGVGSNACSFAAWGAQFEAGPRVSHLIPTQSGASDGQHADLEPRRMHYIDTTHAPVILAVPVMQAGDWFDIVDVGGNAHLNNITVMRGPYSAIAGDASDFEIDVPRWSGRFTFDPEKGLVVT